MTPFQMAMDLEVRDKIVDVLHRYRRGCREAILANQRSVLDEKFAKED